MKVCDVVTFRDRRWLVTLAKPPICILRTWDGQEAEVPSTADKDTDSGIALVATPRRWPFITAPVHPRAGSVVHLVLNRGDPHQALEPLVDWAPSNLVQSGGSLYLNPDLHLNLGETLVATYRSGKKVRLSINPGFANLGRRQRRAREANTPPPYMTVYERLLANTFEDDE